MQKQTLTTWLFDKVLAILSAMPLLVKRGVELSLLSPALGALLFRALLFGALLF